MKNKLFLAFSGIIFIGLLSNTIFAWLIYRDFDAYSKSLREDQLGWVVSSIETSYEDNKWNRQALIDALHWGLMLGFHIKVYDKYGNMLLTSEDVLPFLHPEMKKRMEETIDLKSHNDKERIIKLYAGYGHAHEEKSNSSIGTIVVRSLTPWGIAREKEKVFKEKLILFLGGSIIFVTIASLFIAYLLSYLISRPFKKLKEATERLRQGDLSVRIDIKGKDEVATLSESFNRLTESLQREDELRRHLSSQLTHEMRTPITILKANLEALKDRVISTEKAVSNMEQEVLRLERLTEGMEEIVRAEASLFTKIKPEEIELSKFLKEITGPMEKEFIKKGLYLDIKAEKLHVRSDPEKLTIIIRNIIQNSLRYTERGGITIQAEGNNEEFTIIIRDTGKGIEPSRLPFIFKRFYKDESSEGLGIGLSIVEELVRLLEGSIEVKSEPQKGTMVGMRFRNLK